MEVLQEKILEFLSNQKLLKNIRTGAIVLLLFMIPIIYFGFRASFTFQALLSWDFGSAIVVITLSIFLATIETKTLAYDYTIELDNEMTAMQNDIKDNSKIIRSIDKNGKKSIKWIKSYNKDQQKLYDELLTNDKIDYYEKLALTKRVKGNEKKAIYYEKLIKDLKKKPLRDKHFAPYNIKRIMGIDKINSKLSKKKGDSEIRSNPKQVNIFAILLGMPIRAAGIGMLGTIPFMWSGTIEQVALFYLSYILALIITIVTQYLLTSFRTSHSYKRSLENIITLQELLLTELDYEPSIAKELEQIPFSELEVE